MATPQISGSYLMLFRTCTLTFLLICCSTAWTDASDAANAVAVGKPAPDFAVTGIDGKEFTLSDRLKDKEHHVLLVFSRAGW